MTRRAGSSSPTPVLVVVTGMPAAGKTTIARAVADELRLPLAEKDVVKEILFDALGVGDIEWSRRLGSATYRLLFDFARAQLAVGLPCVLEANFSRGLDEPRFHELPPHFAVQVHCVAPLDVIVARYTARTARDRHPGHLDHIRVDELEGRYASGVHEPLALAGEVIDVDTTRPVDVARLAETIGSLYPRAVSQL